MCASAHPARKFVAIRCLGFAPSSQSRAYVRCTSRHGLFAIRIRFAPSVRKSAGVEPWKGETECKDCKLSIIWNDEVKTACLGLRSVRNYATGFHNFYKIVPLRSVFAPVEFSSKTLTSPINCCKQIQNWAVLALFYARLTPFSSQSGKANDESAARHIKHAGWGETRCVFYVLTLHLKIKILQKSLFVICK